MNSREALKLSLQSADMVAGAYLSDLSDADLLKRPHPECNHVNWQVGHLILAEHGMMKNVVPNMPELPEGFAAMYDKSTATSNDPASFATKEQLMAAYKTQRDATLAALEKVSDADLDKETGISYAPTVGALYSMQGAHWLMHCGQWVIVRRQLGKPVLI